MTTTTMSNEATQRLKEYATLKTRRDVALDQSGIGHDFGERFNKAGERIAAFCADLQTRANRQALYDLATNVPCGIMSALSATPDRALRSAIAGACGAFVKWDVRLAMELAADILEDVNAHPEAAKLREWADKA